MVTRKRSAPRFAKLLSGALFRVRTGGWNNLLSYTFTRFWTVRRSMRWIRSRYPRPPLPATSATVFRELDAESLKTQLEQQGYFEGLLLPDSYVKTIREFADVAECTQYTGYGMSGTPIRFQARNWKEAQRQSGHPLPMGRIRDPAEACPAIREIEQDPLLLDIVGRYLGYAPSHVESRLYWSFVRDDLDPQARADLGQNVLYHYDLPRGQADVVFVQFYLTDVGPQDGALCLIPGSHRAKPLSFLLGSANQSDRRIASTYGENAGRSMEGPAGSGFAMDGYCIHRATPPLAHDRLMLQMRFA
jgi:hypothetical protein